MSNQAAATRVRSFVEEFDSGTLVREIFDASLRAWHEYTVKAPDTSTQVRWRAERGVDVDEAIAFLRSALEKLGNRTGARENSAREWLIERLDCLVAARDAYDALGVARKGSGTFLGLEGPLGVELTERLSAAHDALADARHRFELTPAAKIRAARDALDVAEAEWRDVLRAFTAARDAARCPRVDLAPLKAAEERTRLLATSIKGPRMKALHVALDQGRDATADVARLFVVFEPADAHEAYAFRAQRAEEK